VIDAVNLDPGSDAIAWSRAAAQLDDLRPHGGSGPTCWLATIGPDGRAHVAGVVGHWLDDRLYFVSGARTTKGRNLSADGRCTFAVSLPDLDLVLDGSAAPVTDPATLARVAERYGERGWPLAVEGDQVRAPFWAPTAPPPPWRLHAFAPVSALGVATAPPSGATRWTFAS
jgi:hypothetical protein